MIEYTYGTHGPYAVPCVGMAGRVVGTDRGGKGRRESQIGPGGAGLGTHTYARSVS